MSGTFARRSSESTALVLNGFFTRKQGFLVNDAMAYDDAVCISKSSAELFSYEDGAMLASRAADRDG